MKNISTIFFNILLTTLFSLSLIIFYTENVSSFDDEIIHHIESKLDDTLNAKTKIDSVVIKWSGLKPRILIKNFLILPET